jgi:hypothetical protein
MIEMAANLVLLMLGNFAFLFGSAISAISSISIET